MESFYYSRRLQARFGISPNVGDGADIIFELNVTPNRADCLSHIGLARELCDFT